jgi:hypothetical protein
MVTPAQEGSMPEFSVLAMHSSRRNARLLMISFGFRGRYGD